MTAPLGTLAERQKSSQERLGQKTAIDPTPRFQWLNAAQANARVHRPAQVHWPAQTGQLKQNDAAFKFWGSERTLDHSIHAKLFDANGVPVVVNAPSGVHGADVPSEDQCAIAKFVDRSLHPLRHVT